MNKLPRYLLSLPLIIALGLVASAVTAKAQSGGGSNQINLPWSTTYNCAETDQFQTWGSLWPNCDGIRPYGAWSTNGKGEQITSAANNPSGGGGRGQRQWNGDGQNANSGSTIVEFAPVSEIYIRWYMRYMPGFSWNPLSYDKILYLNNSIIPEFTSSDNWNFYNGSANHPIAGAGFATMNGGATGDGNFHCFEIHMKRNGGSNDDLGEVWMDGVYKGSVTGFDFPADFSSMIIGENQAQVNNGGPSYLDYDDLAIQTTGPIGCLGSPTPAPTAPAPAPSGEAYCSRVKGGDLNDPNLLFCEDFETPTLYNNEGLGNGAPYYGPWYDSTGQSGNRGVNSYWNRVYGNGVNSALFSSGQPANPTYGSPCAYPLCVGLKVWDAQNRWSANAYNPLIGIFTKDSDFSAEVGTILPPTNTSDGGDGVFQGNASLADRVSAGYTHGIFGEAHFNTTTTELGLTMALAYPNNSFASGVWGTSGVPGAWKHNQWSTVYSPNCGSDGIGPFYNQAAHELRPFAGFLAAYGTSCTGVPYTGPVNVTVGSARAINDVGILWTADETRYQQSRDFPDGTWACVRVHLSGIGTSNLRHRIWLTPSAGPNTGVEQLILDYTADGSYGLDNRLGYNGMKWNAYANTNQGMGYVASTQTTFRYEDNVHARAGVPVSCQQIGFNGGGGTPPPVDTTAPTVSLTAPSNGATVSGTATISASASDNVGVVGVQFKLDGANLGSEDTTSPYSMSWNTTTATNGSHSLMAVARDAAGNMTTSAARSVTVSNATADTTAPSAPSGLAASALSSSQISLSWVASTDNVGVTGYQLQRCQGTGCTNFAQIATPSGTSYNNTGLSANTTYRYRVRATDAAGNLSSFSSTVAATTTSGQTTPSGGITLPWSTTYDCAETDQLQTWYSAWPNCDGIRPYGAWTANGKAEQITSAANNPSGGGGRGQRQWNGDGGNVNSGSTIVEFAPVSEIYVRWYMRYMPGFSWNTLQYDKILYFNNSMIPIFYSADYFDFYTSSTHHPIAGAGFATMNGGPTGDGNFHCFEIHMKRNGGSNDDLGEMWMDGVYKGSVTGFDFPADFSSMIIGENQALVSNGGPSYLDYDDLAIQTTGPIGCLPQGGQTPPAPTATLTANPASITNGASSTLTWASTNATSCTGSGLSTGGAVSGTATVSPTANTTYSVTCMGAGGNASASASVTVGTTPPLSGGLLAAWAFDELSGSSAADSSGNNFSGALVNGPVWSTGKVGNALQFNATDNGNDDDDPRVVIGRTLDLPALPLSFAAWVNPEDYADWRVIFSKRDSVAVADARVDLGLLQSSGQVYLFTGTIYEFTYAPPVNTWTHLAVVATSSGTSLYVNGALNQTIGPITLGGSATANAVIGGTGEAAGGDNDPFKGKIDELRIYTSAITQSDITALYNPSSGSGSDTTAPTVSLTAPGNGATVSGTTTVSASASDNVGVVGVQFKLDGANLGSEDTTSSYSLSWDTTIATNGSHSLTAVARDAAGNMTTSATRSVTVSNVTADTTAPSASSGLAASALSSSQISLSWAASTDNVGVTGYQLERCQGTGCTNFAQIATPSGTSYNNTGLLANTTYRYRVRATDAAGNLSSFSSAVAATTQSLPVPTVTLTANPASITNGNSSTLTWAATNATSCAGSGFSTGGATSGTATVSPTSNTTYSMSCTGAGGSDSASASVTVTAPADTTAPSTPSGLTASVVSLSQINLSWNAATDNVGVTGYQLQRCQGTGCTNFAQIATPSGTSYNNTGLLANTTYRYRVRATDAAGNLSSFSSVVGGTTQSLPVPTATLTANPASIMDGESSTLTWASTNATSCAGNGFSAGGTTSGTATVSPSADATYTVTCTGAGGSAEGSATVTVTASPSSGDMPFNDDFESGLNWVQNGYVEWYDGDPKGGTHSVRLSLTGSIEKPISLQGYKGVTVSFMMGSDSLENGSENVKAMYYDGTDWQILAQITDGDANDDGQLHAYSVKLPETVNNLATFAVRFEVDGSGTGDYGFVDEVRVRPETTIFSDGFESAMNWSETGDVDWHNGNPKSDSHSVRLRLTGMIEKTISLAGYDQVTVSFNMGGHSLENGWENVQALYYDGTGWQILAKIADPDEDGNLHAYSFQLPETVDNLATFALRFLVDASGTGDFGFVDDVVVSGLASDVPPAVDTTAPSVPANLAANTMSSSQIHLSWSASTDNMGVTGYQLQRCQGTGCTNFIGIATPSGTSHNDTGLNASTNYRYRIRAMDAADNLSSYSSTVAATTQPPAAVCGNGTVESGEACEVNDAQSCSINGYAGSQSCLSDCSGYASCSAVESCGDGTVNGTEICEIGATRACSANGYAGVQVCAGDCSGYGSCAATEFCGDGKVNGNEVCDDGNTVDGDGCSAVCQTEAPVLSCDQTGQGAFFGCYYDDMTLSNLVLTRTDAAVDFNWGSGGPNALVGSDGFSAQWRGNFNFSAGTWSFNATSDDGVRVYVDNALVIDGWTDQAATTYTKDVVLSGGTHEVRVEYYENGGAAVIQVSWDIAPSPGYVCSDGTDNDGDGLTDYPADPGCTNATDNDEYNAPPSGGNYTRVFYDDFEDGTINKWQEDWNHEGVEVLSTAYDGGRAQSGTRFAATNWNGDAYTGLLLSSFDYDKELFIRMWWRLDQDVDNADGGKLLRLGFNADANPVNELMIGNSDNLYEAWSVGSYGNLVEACWSNHNIKDNNWHKVEIYIKDDNTDGRLQIWVDGVDTSGCYPFIGDTSSGADWFPLYMPSNWSMNPGWEHDSANHFYIDNVEIFTDATTGEPATGSLMDGTVAVSGSSQTPVCGNGTVETGEACEVNDTQSCSANGYAGTKMCLSDCSGYAPCSAVESCGDGTVNGNEQCDDGNTTSGDGCSATCQTEAPPVDTIAPSAPAGLVASAVSSSQINLSWNAATDNVGVTGYQLYRCQGSGCTNFTQITTPGGTSYNNTSLSANTTYRYRVRATDAAGNFSSFSSTVAATTQAESGGSTLADECTSVPSSWVFCNDFDAGVSTDSQRRAQWDDYDGALDVNFILDPGPGSSSSNHVAQFRAPSGQPGGADLIKVFNTTYDKLYTRWYVKYEPGFNFNAANHGGGLHAGDRNFLGRSGIRPNGNEWFQALVDYDAGTPHTPYLYTYYRGMYQDCTDPNGSCWGDAFPCVYGSGYCSKPQHLPTVTLPNLQAGQWYCIETMVDAGTPTSTESGANGAMALWVDGQSLGSWNDLWFRTTSSLKLSTLWLSLFHHDGTHSDEGVLYDNVVVSTERIGCSGGGGSTPGGGEILRDDFESSLSWSQSGNVEWYTGTPKNGSYAVHLRTTGAVEKTIPLTGYENIQVSFKMGSGSLDNGNENLQALYFDGNAWVELARINDGDAQENTQLNAYSIDLPAGVDHLSTFALRFKLNGSGTGDHGYVDDVVVLGDGAAVPPAAQCSDGADNDGDGLTDYPADPGCANATDNDEYNAPSPPSSGNYTRVFYDGSEAGNTNLWEQDGYRNKCTSVASSADGIAGPYKGSRMIRCNWNGSVVWNDPAKFETLALPTVPYTNEILYRVRIRPDQNVDHTGGSSMKVMRIFYHDGVSANLRDLVGTMATGNGMGNQGLAGTTRLTSYWGDASGDQTAMPSTWGEVEYYMNHSTGQVKVWHDGVLVRDDTASFNSQQWQPFYLTSNFEDPHDAVNYVYFDEIEVFTDAATGSPTTGSLSSGTVAVSGGTFSPVCGNGTVESGEQCDDGNTSSGDGCSATCQTEAPPADTTVPSAPGGLTASAVSTSQINLSWNAATDNVGVTGYQLQRCQGTSCTNFVQIATPSGTSYNNTGLSANTTYRYRVRATDAAGNLSSYSTTVAATTPSVPTYACSDGMDNDGDGLTDYPADPGCANATDNDEYNAPPPSGGNYTRVFYDGSEAGNTNLWSQDGYRNKCTSVASSADGIAGPYKGSRMIRCNWNGSVVWNDPAKYETLALPTVPYTNEILYRIRIRPDQNAARTSGSAMKVLRIFNHDGTWANTRDLFEILRTGNGLNNSGVAGTTSLTTYWGDASGDQTALSSAWGEVEYYINQTTGQIKVWHDGVLVRDDTASFNSQQWQPFYLTSNFEDAHDAVNYVYFDEIEVFTDAATGSPTTGSLSNGTVAVSSGGN